MKLQEIEVVPQLYDVFGRSQFIKQRYVDVLVAIFPPKY